MSIDTITSGSERGMWARYYAKDSIRLAPQQHGADAEALQPRILLRPG